jgi:hypothetical protein
MKITKKKKNNIQIHSIICPYLFFFCWCMVFTGLLGVGFLTWLEKKIAKIKKKKKKAFAATVVSWYWCSYVSWPFSNIIELFGEISHLVGLHVSLFLLLFVSSNHSSFLYVPFAHIVTTLLSWLVSLLPVFLSILLKILGQVTGVFPCGL